MEKNLYSASTQWRSRPADERFWDMNEMLAVTTDHRKNAVIASAQLADVEVIGYEQGGLTLRGKSGRETLLGHHAFGQMSRLMGAPADYLRNLPAPLAAQNLNHGLRNIDDKDRQLNFLLRKQGDKLTCRAATTEAFKRVWNCDLVERVKPLTQQGWRVAPARPSGVAGERVRIATETDCLKRRMPGLGIKPGDQIAPAGLYASEKDMFLFLINEDTTIDAGGGNFLSRGFFLENSEVGNGRALTITTFLYNFVCGNHIVWGAEGVSVIKVVHRGDADERAFHGVETELKGYLAASASQTEQQIKGARTRLLGDTKDEAIDVVFSKRLPGLTRGEIEGSFEQATLHPEDHQCDPKSVWALAQGMTRYSQQATHTDTRVRLDRTAGKIMALAF